MSRSLILGTAGHIDHGKTALVMALTGIDTDRLKEEKERGITIDLGFAEWAGHRVHLGIVDVPGHEGFVRNMLAGATGMDVVLLVVAADESVMPQTREHVAIVSLLGVSRLVVALTKIDLVEEEWLQLVHEEVLDLLAGTPFEDFRVVGTSAKTGEGLDELAAALNEAAAEVSEEVEDDLARLPVDRVFTVHGTGTVVTGTLWSGALKVGQHVAIRPGGLDARIRSLEVHGRTVEEARAGQRTAVALVGSGVERASMTRGQVLVGSLEWPATHMLTVRLEVLATGAWSVEHNQRVRVHIGTAEVMARVVLLGRTEAIGPGGQGWAQLRLEAPVLARARDRFVIRSYSPVTTIGGGSVAEPLPPKRKGLSGGVEDALAAILEGAPERSVAAVAGLVGSRGAPLALLPVVTGLAEAPLREGVRHLEANGGLTMSETTISGAAVADARSRLRAAVDRFHKREPLRPGASLESLRATLPVDTHPDLADAILEALREAGELEIEKGVVRRAGFKPQLSESQAALRREIEELFREAGWAPPRVDEFPASLEGQKDLWPILHLLEAQGLLTALDDALFIWSSSLDGAIGAVQARFGGQEGLGPADFREALPITRKHLIPLLGHLDRLGVTVREGQARHVPVPS